MKRIGIIQVIKEDTNKFALPNLFTVLRLVFLPFILFFLWQGTRQGDMLALIFMLAACCTDFLDGYLARRLNKKSDLGRMLDPLIDKISVDAAMLVLTAQKGLPFWYVTVVICRDLFLLLGGTVVISKKRLVIESNMLGKTTATVFALVIITYTLNLPYIKQALMYISLVLVPMTVIGYVHKYYDELRRLSKHKRAAVEPVKHV
ncbi:MAG: CDP-diacylglycerol--glycerol-3-phosphate 3-phosphatidyltransferase [candidate division KSB1 bacterium]|nr:CDP-diacylglycerol--glycerol-3-phosphate 3-phosphatidyltransferase [candidate division KSB1 bacterium]MDZ7346552.1 CDP-diacylglycerol--glycerol-3-phosphate 3-phosphatidyltransferase [candidate division KSB1 bacterium]